MRLFGLESLIITPTCFQSEKPRSIDLILKNRKSLFKNSKTFEVGIFNHHATSFNINEESIYSRQPKDPVLPRLLIF